MEYRIKITTTQNKITFKTKMSAAYILNLINTGSLINYIDDEDDEEVNLFICHLQLVSISGRVYKEEPSVNNTEGLNDDDFIVVSNPKTELPYSSVAVMDEDGKQFNLYVE